MEEIIELLFESPKHLFKGIWWLIKGVFNLIVWPFRAFYSLVRGG